MKKNKHKKPAAVALTYDGQPAAAPRVTAKGRGDVADKIIALARAHDIPVHSDPDLLEMLSQLDLNREIPPVLYEVVAELLAFIYLLKTERHNDDTSLS